MDKHTGFAPKPKLEKTRFTEMLIQANGMDRADFTHWVFYPGMLFQAPNKWWGDGGPRDFPHEGLDFCLYQDASGRVGRLGPETRIPLMHPGVVRSVFSDYLGRTVLIEHEDTSLGQGKWVSIYAHTRPEKHIEPGAALKAGDIVATIADTQRSKAKLMPHLHLSLGVVAGDLDYEGFVWNHMRNPDRVRLLDPIALLDWPHRMTAQRSRRE